MNRKRDAVRCEVTDHGARMSRSAASGIRDAERSMCAESARVGRSRLRNEWMKVRAERSIKSPTHRWRLVLATAVLLDSCRVAESPPAPPSVVVEPIGRREVRVLREFVGTTEG